MRKGFEKGRCVFTSEKDKFAVKTYMANFPGSVVHGDVTKIDASTIPDHDVLLAGFPCQPFSLSGVSKNNSLQRSHGFAHETSGTLFFDIVRILEARKPKAFLLENVKNLLSHDKGKTFSVVMQTLERELGYSVFYKVIDGACFVPQHRERVYLVGYREKKTENIFDGMVLPEKGSVLLKSVLHGAFETPEHPYTKHVDGCTVVEDKYTLSQKLWEYLKEYKEKHKKKGNGFGYGLVTENDVARTLSARYYKDGSEILVEQEGKLPRRLTPRECARLMGFEDSFVIPASDTQAYKQFGNSVVVPVVKTVAEFLLKNM
jgi:DNA (cytosine-5)-methyltransferase 1